jgi:LacI family transcriptional regulator
MSRPTIADIAREAQVSTTAVSLYLHNKPGLGEGTRERIAQAVDKLGYMPRGQRRGNASALIGLLVEELPLPLFSDIFYAEMVQGLESRARQLGYHTVLTVVDPPASNNIPTLVAERQVAGLVAVGGGDLTDEFIASIASLAVPLVLVDNYLLEGAADCVLPDNEMGAYNATRHLIERGHRRIAVIMGPAKYKPLIDRQQGYLRAMMEAGLGPDPELMQPSLSKGVPNKGYREMHALLARPQRPTAVFCVSDRTAFGALTAVKEVGLRVPEDIALVGFDDVRESEHTNPPLTTVRVPKREMGVVAAQRLTDLIKHPQADVPPLKLVLPTYLVIRATS